MATYGVTSTGFARKPLAQILTDVRGALQAAFGTNVDLSDEGPFGQLVADLSAPVDEVWQVAEDCYGSFDPDQSVGPRLVSLCGITGTVPVTPTRSTTTVVAIGTAGSPVPLLSRAKVANGGPAFRTTVAGTIAALGAWAPYTAAPGDLRTNGGNVYRCFAGGATAASGGPTGTAADIVDGAAHWRFLGTGTAAVELAAESVDLGAIAAPAGSISLIDTPVAGLLAITNPLDAVLGIAPETDPQLRLRRLAELAAAGEGGIDSIRADLLKIVGVTDARIFENTGDATDPTTGLPPHSVEALVLGGADADVAGAVFKKGAGIQTYGSTTVTVNDLGGNPHTVNFSRPTSRLIYVTVHVTKETDTTLPQYPVDGDAQVAAAIVNFATGQTPDFRGYRVSDPVITSKLYRPIESVAGVRDVTSITIGTSPSPTSSANLTFGLRDLASFDTSRVVVVSS